VYNNEQKNSKNNISDIINSYAYRFLWNACNLLYL